MQPIASVVIPTYQHGHVLRDAIESVLAQTAQCEAIVVDDGSTDSTPEVMQRYAKDPRVKSLRIPHGGPSRARNAGLDQASAPFVMFLDADDLLDRRKVKKQLEVFDRFPETGWVICDVQIEDERRREHTTASARYDYAGKGVGQNAWVHAQLAASNFIPIMAPLVRRSAIPAWLRYCEEKIPEDWHFWCEVASLLRMRYVPEVLATYRKRRTGRHALPPASRTVYPTITHPLRLNLGCGARGTPTWHPIPGMVNLDKTFGWTFEEGLRDFPDHSVAGITISHALMYVPEQHWYPFFADVARVLAEGGVVRVTEDRTDEPKSRAYRGWRGSDPFVTLTTPQMMRSHMARAGLEAVEVGRRDTQFTDPSLLQAHHGNDEDVFFMEGVKPPAVLFAPHCDDEVLFSAFTILRHRLRVVVCYPSAGDYGDTAVRQEETRAATTMLGAASADFWNGGDLVAQMQAYDTEVHPARVWAPSIATSHQDHLAVALAAVEVFGERVTQYHTYQHGEKVRLGVRVPFEPVWIGQKLRALCCYQSQIAHERANQFFCQDLYEYEVPR